MIGFVTWPPLLIMMVWKRWPSDKANHNCENMLYKLLYVIQVVKKIFDK